MVLADIGYNLPASRGCVCRHWPCQHLVLSPLLYKHQNSPGWKYKSCLKNSPCIHTMHFNVSSTVKGVEPYHKSNGNCYHPILYDPWPSIFHWFLTLYICTTCIACRISPSLWWPSLCALGSICKQCWILKCCPLRLESRDIIERGEWYITLHPQFKLVSAVHGTEKRRDVSL